MQKISAFLSKNYRNAYKLFIKKNKWNVHKVLIKFMINSRKNVLVAFILVQLVKKINMIIA